jgi:OsmC-like protein.
VNLPLVTAITKKGRYRFTRVVLRPTIVVADGAALNRTALALEDAHRACLIANSIRAEVVVEPDIQLSGVE